jgi:HAD superfamily hydrolase (TIGR01509 family)
MSEHIVRAVVFDLDGLMFNTEELYELVGAELLGRRGHEFSPDLIDAMMGRPGSVALRIMIDWHGLDDTVEKLAAETFEIFPPILDAHLAPMPGLVDLLASLETAGLPKAIATSSGRHFTHDVLGRFEFLPRFSFVLTAEDVTQGKPHPEVYLLAAERHGVDPTEMVVFEDSANGCRAAVAAGATVVAVPGGHSLRHSFEGAAFVAKSLEDPRVHRLLGLA